MSKNSLERFPLRSLITAALVLTFACSTSSETGAAPSEASDSPTPRSIPEVSSDAGEVQTTTEGTATTAVGGAGGAGSEGDAGAGNGAANQNPDQQASGSEEGGNEAPQQPPPSVDESQPAFGRNSPISTVGIGEVFFGMTPEQAATAARTEWAKGDASASGNCYVVAPVRGPEGVRLWVYRGHIEAVAVEDPAVRTRSGLGLGTTQAKLMEVFDEKLDVREHRNKQGWRQALFTPSDEADAAFRIIFDLNLSGEVAFFWAGRAELAFFTESELLELAEC